MHAILNAIASLLVLFLNVYLNIISTVYFICLLVSSFVSDLLVISVFVLCLITDCLFVLNNYL